MSDPNAPKPPTPGGPPPRRPPPPPTPNRAVVAPPVPAPKPTAPHVAAPKPGAPRVVPVQAPPVAPAEPEPPLSHAPVSAAPLSNHSLLASLGFDLLEALPSRGATSRFRVRTPEGTERLFTRVSGTAAPLEQQLFLAGARVMRELQDRKDILAVHAVYEEQGAFLSDLWTVGSTADLSALRWSLEQKLVFIQAVGGALQAIHELGLIHGCLCPSNVLLNDDLMPVITEAGTISIADHMTRADELDNEYKAFAAPEVLKGILLDATVDVYSLAQLAHFVFLGETPPPDPSPLPKLDALSKLVPDGITRVIRRGTARASQARYRTIRAFLEDLRNYKNADVGLPREGDASLQNRGAPTSLPPGKRPANAASKARPPRAPEPKGATKMWLLALGLVLVLALAGAAFLIR